MTNPLASYFESLHDLNTTQEHKELVILLGIDQLRDLVMKGLQEGVSADDWVKLRDALQRQRILDTASIADVKEEGASTHQEVSHIHGADSSADYSITGMPRIPEALCQTGVLRSDPLSETSQINLDIARRCTNLLIQAETDVSMAVNGPEYRRQNNRIVKPAKAELLYLSNQDQLSTSIEHKLAQVRYSVGIM